MCSDIRSVLDELELQSPHNESLEPVIDGAYSVEDSPPESGTNSCSSTGDTKTVGADDVEGTNVPDSLAPPPAYASRRRCP